MILKGLESELELAFFLVSKLLNQHCDLGSISGIGLETARDLSSRGARLILAVRNMEKGIKAAKDIMETTGNNNLVVRKLDLASIEEVRKFAQQVNDAEEK